MKIEYIPAVLNLSLAKKTVTKVKMGEMETMGCQQPVPVPQLIRIYIQDKNNKMTTVFEEFPITETTERSISLNLEEGQNGAYKVTRDSKNIIAEVVNYNDTK